MERLIVYFLTVVVACSFYSCRSGKTSSPNNTIPFQIFPDNNNCIVSLTKSEAGADNYILTIRDSSYEKDITVLGNPCAPIIHSVSNDTIFINYYAFGHCNYPDNTFLNSPSCQNSEIIGKYNIVSRYYYSLESEELYAHWEPRAQAYGWFIDSISFSKDSVYCFEGIEFVRGIPINKFLFKKEKNSFCTFEIDTNYKNIQWIYFYSTEGVKQKYRKHLSFLINTL